MEVRRITEADMPELARLYKEFWDEDSCVAEMQAAFQRLNENPNYIVLVAEQDGHLAGTAMGIICEELYGDCRPFMVIEDVVVEKNHRRGGVGSALMHELEKWGTDNNCKYVIFVTESDRVGAHRFYESLGYSSETHSGFKKKLSSPAG